MAYPYRIGATLGLLAVYTLVTGCQRWPYGTPDATIVLGQAKGGRGLSLREAADGPVIPTNVDGIRCVKLRQLSENYIYFAVDSRFKSSTHMNGLLWVEFLAPRRGSFDVQYDGYKFGVHTSEDIYSDTCTGIHFDGSPSWNRVALELPDARLENRQNGQADFRLRVICPEFYVRRVSLTLQEKKKPIPRGAASPENPGVDGRSSDAEKPRN